MSIKIIVLAVALSLFSAPVMDARDAVFTFEHGGVKYGARYLIEDKIGAVSPLVIFVKQQGIIHVSIAYHPGEGLFYLFSDDSKIAAGNRGFFIVERSCISFANSDYVLTVEEAERAFGDPEYAVKLARGLMDRFDARSK